MADSQFNWSESELAAARGILGEPNAEDIIGTGGAQLLPGLESSSSSWTRPETLPDLHGVSLAAVDLETNDVRLRVNLGPGHAMRDGYICGVSVAFRAGRELRSLYVPIKHPG